MGRIGRAVENELRLAALDQVHTEGGEHTAGGGAEADLGVAGPGLAHMGVAAPNLVIFRAVGCGPGHHAGTGGEDIGIGLRGFFAERSRAQAPFAGHGHLPAVGAQCLAQAAADAEAVLDDLSHGGGPAGLTAH